MEDNIHAVLYYQLLRMLRGIPALFFRSESPRPGCYYDFTSKLELTVIRTILYLTEYIHNTTQLLFLERVVFGIAGPLTRPAIRLYIHLL